MDVLSEFRKYWRLLAIIYCCLLFPEVIKPMDNGKFIFFPRETEIRRSISFFDALEVWDKNENLTQSPLELPINFDKEIFNIATGTQSFWIFQM